MSMTPRRSDVKSQEPLKAVPINQQHFFVHLEPTKERYKGDVIYKDGFGQRVAFV